MTLKDSEYYAVVELPHPHQGTVDALLDKIKKHGELKALESMNRNWPQLTWVDSSDKYRAEVKESIEDIESSLRQALEVTNLSGYAAGGGGL